MEILPVFEMCGALENCIKRARSKIFYLSEQVRVGREVVRREENVRGLLQHIAEVIGRLPEGNLRSDLEQNLQRYEREIDSIRLRDYFLDKYGRQILVN